MDAAMWIIFMYIGPVLSAAALVGIPIRVIQLFKGDLQRRFRRLLPWGKGIVALGAVSAVGVLFAAAGAIYELYSNVTCNVGGGCAQGEFSVAFSLGVLGVAYVIFELLLLPFILPIAQARYAQPNL
jgi:hypothetical protein